MNPDQPAFPRSWKNTIGEDLGANGMSVLLYLIAHAPPVPKGHPESEERHYDYDKEQRGPKSYLPIPPAERESRWRIEYALKQIEEINKMEGGLKEKINPLQPNPEPKSL